MGNLRFLLFFFLLFSCSSLFAQDVEPVTNAPDFNYIVFNGIICSVDSNSSGPQGDRIYYSVTFDNYPEAVAFSERWQAALSMRDGYLNLVFPIRSGPDAVVGGVVLCGLQSQVSLMDFMMDFHSLFGNTSFDLMGTAVTFHYAISGSSGDNIDMEALSAINENILVLIDGQQSVLTVVSKIDYCLLIAVGFLSMLFGGVLFLSFGRFER